MSRVAIVTDSASDMDPARAASLGIAIVPLLVSFGNETFSAGIDLTRDDFWARVKTPGTPIATTAACSPGTFQQVYQKAFDDGADSIVSVHVADTLSGTLKAAQVARASMAGRDIRIVDSTSASNPPCRGRRHRRSRDRDVAPRKDRRGRSSPVTCRGRRAL